VQARAVEPPPPAAPVAAPAPPVAAPAPAPAPEPAEEFEGRRSYSEITDEPLLPSRAAAAVTAPAAAAPDTSAAGDTSAPPVARAAAAPSAPTNEGATSRSRMKALRSLALTPSSSGDAAAPAEAAAPTGVKMVTLTLLDGTTVRLPAPGSKRQDAQQATEGGLTASDLVSALLARAQGADVSDVLPDQQWEVLFASLLTLLIRKGLLADWEFVEEWKKRQGS